MRRSDNKNIGKKRRTEAVLGCDQVTACKTYWHGVQGKITYNLYTGF